MNYLKDVSMLRASRKGPRKSTATSRRFCAASAPRQRRDLDFGTGVAKPALRPDGIRYVKTLVVVDDEREITSTLQAYLELYDYRVVVAANGVEALEQIAGEAPDLIITDITMPRMNGVELIRELQAQPEGRQIPVIMISAHERRLDLPFLRKPFDPKALLAQVRHLLEE
jgi:chemosensory pili system protein ChpA (sensor histidine kinase/response regulator)